MSSTLSPLTTSIDQEFLADVIDGLSRTQKTLPCKYFYDARGSKLFDQICELEEYYPTRTELGIMQSEIERMADAIGSDCTLIEFGSGSSLKTRLLLDHLSGPLTYAPVDISGDYLHEVADDLRENYPELDIVPLVADFTQPIGTEALAECPARRVVYFPGSTIGNFTITEAQRLLSQMVALAGPAGSILIGIDLKKDQAVLEAAYNDVDGVTAEFNRNLLRRINDGFDADFDLDQFRHEAIWNAKQSRIEMHLVSEVDQQVTIQEHQFDFSAGESIHTENSHKYSLERFSAMANSAGLQIETHWMDERDWFAVLHCTVQ